MGLFIIHRVTLSFFSKSVFLWGVYSSSCKESSKTNDLQLYRGMCHARSTLASLELLVSFAVDLALHLRCCYFIHRTDHDPDHLDHLDLKSVDIVLNIFSVKIHPKKRMQIMEIIWLPPGSTICGPCNSYRPGVHLP